MDVYWSVSSDTLCPGVNAANISFNGSTAVTTLHSIDAVGNNSHEQFTELFYACNCTTWKSDTQDAYIISVIRIITSLFSVVGSASIILLVLLAGKLNTAEVHPLFILSVADFILAILWLIGGVVWLSPDANGWARSESASHTGMCYVLAVSTTMAEIVTFLLTAVYAQSALLRIREYYLNKGKILLEQDKKKRLRYVVTSFSYVFSWLLPLIVVLSVTETLVGIEATDRGCWCIVDFFNLRPDNGDISRDSVFNRFAIIQASLIGPFFILTAGIILIYYFMTMWYVKKIYAMQAHNHQSSRHRSQLRRVIKTVMIRLSLFILIYLSYGAPTFAGAIAVWSESNRLYLSETPDKIILYIHALLAPMQGFWNAIVYGWSRKEFRDAIKLHPLSKDNNNSNYQSLNNSEKKEKDTA